MPKPPEIDPVPPGDAGEAAVGARSSLRYVLMALRWLGLAVIWIVLLGLMAWATLAIYYTDLSSNSPRALWAGLFVAVAVAVVILARRRLRYAFAALLVMFGLVVLWFFSRTPSNDRDWALDVAQLPWAATHGSRVVLHNVRNFSYRSETDYTPAWEDRTYDLDKVESADLILVYWGSKSIAHVIVSFGFSDGQYLSISIETRKEKFESYSTVQGFFRQYELYYVFADERDVLRLRTDFRNEDVYIYHTRVTPAQARESLVSYLDSANALRDKPQWYNALTTNCATSVLPHVRASGKSGEWSTDILMSGHAGRQAYRNGHLDDSMPFDELEAKSHINVAAKAAGESLDFSQKIRAGLPNPMHPSKATSGPSAR
jgi:hypothetical protein